MATDYDTPRQTGDVDEEEGFKELKTRRADTVGGLVDLEESDNEPLELPGADLSGEELTVKVLPRQADEFTCTRCFLVVHRSRMVRHTRSESVCRDCV